MANPNDNGNQEELTTQEEPTTIKGHSICPHCGSEKRVVADYVAQLKKKKVISEDSFPQAAGVWEIPFADQKRMSILQTVEPIRMFPTLRIIFDVCGTCMKVFILEVTPGQQGILNPQAFNQQQKSMSR